MNNIIENLLEYRTVGKETLLFCLSQSNAISWIE